MQSGSTNQVELNRAVIVSTTIPLPPLLEQQRIVAKLYALLNQTAHARAAGLDRIPTLIGKYKESLLTAAFSGDLTREWRELTGLSEPRTVTLDDLCSSITDGDHQAPPRVEKGIPFITIAAMNDGQIQIDKATRYVPKSYADSLKPDRRPRPGDVL
jgi:type I restriction enzyme S subunit